MPFENLKNHRILLIIVLSACTFGSVLITGLVTELSLGDEVYQYRFAKIWYETGKRPTYDPLLETSHLCQYFFDSDPLWAMGLILVWKVMGEISLVALQLYQAGFFLALILGCYLLGAQLYDQQTGLKSALLAAGCPFFLAYSVLGYLDVPAAVLIVFTFLMFTKKRYALAGLFAGLAFIAKRNTWLLIPALGILLLLNKNNRFKSIILFAIPAGLVGIPELVYKYLHWGNIFFAPQCWQKPEFSIPASFNYTPSNIIYNPLSIIQYFGIALLASLAIYVLFHRQKREDALLLWPVVSYFLLWLYFFYGQWAVRYIAPILGLLCILGAVGLSKLKFRKIKWAIFVICIIQIIASLAYTYKERQFSDGIKEAHVYVKTQLPEEARIMYPEYSLAEKTGRPMIWIRINELFYLFWESDETELHQILDRYKTQYIMVKKVRIYDDGSVKHRLGYPKSFIEKLHQYKSLELIFENNEIEIWQL